ncbi:putative plant disease resistance response protein [Rosa chinensis]|uniref:Dirigent protein n=1 Tax=Rosa chinensis TaxID=74649 RepID=A0A2P6RTJ8_ROSCH|nr:dirigent protein 25 [Rosa chinensis]PRQ49741.1 putative plant disease resistance response protein [Rosa chinensis]
MATQNSTPLPLKAITYLFLLALAITHTTSARVLDEETDTPQTQIPVSTVPPSVVGATSAGPPPVVSATSAGPSATVANGESYHPLSFFLHDIIGGTNPSARAVTGIVTNPAVNGQVPFAKPNGAVVQGGNNGIPQNNNNNGIINNNNVPFFTGLGGNINNNLRQNNNNFIGGNNGFPVVNGAQLPPGQSLQKLMFGTLTVFDDELTEGHELGSGLLGKAQGFYVASSEDGSSQTIAFTAMFESGGYADSLTFFGVHRIAASESHLAVMGGTGKYLNAKGYALVKTINGVNEQNTDGIDTVLQFTVYLSY